jgi:hypothetical protein
MSGHQPHKRYTRRSTQPNATGMTAAPCQPAGREGHGVAADGYWEKTIVPSAAQLDVITDFRSGQQG